MLYLLSYRGAERAYEAQLGRVIANAGMACQAYDKPLRPKGWLRRIPDMPMWKQPDESSTMAAKIRFANRHFHLPQSKPIRIGLGIRYGGR